MLHFLDTNIDISHLSNFKTKAIAKYFFEISSREDVEKLKDLYEFAKQKNLWVLIVGWGTNMLFAFDVYDGIVIKNNLTGYHYNPKTFELQAFSQQKIWDLAQDLETLYQQNIWHRFIGLPGSIWWAVYGNAGCFWLETASNFVKVDVYNLDTHQFETLQKSECEFSYRESIFKNTKKYFIIQAYFDLSEVQEKYASDVDNIYFRQEVQPAGNSCGSFFKNPSQEYSAGKMIEEVWLRWYIHKNAFFSPKHANFLMAKSQGWDFRDQLFLIQLAQKKVQEKFWVFLTPEVQIITNKDV